MKRDNKKALYESIMTSVAREVKKSLNENYWDDEYYPSDINNNDVVNIFQKYIDTGKIKLHPSVLAAIKDAAVNEISWEDYEIKNKAGNLQEFMTNLFTYGGEDDKLINAIERLENSIAYKTWHRTYEQVEEVSDDAVNEIDFLVLMALSEVDWTRCKADKNAKNVLITKKQSQYASPLTTLPDPNQLKNPKVEQLEKLVHIYSHRLSKKFGNYKLKTPLKLKEFVYPIVAIRSNDYDKANDMDTMYIINEKNRIMYLEDLLDMPVMYDAILQILKELYKVL